MNSLKMMMCNIFYESMYSDHSFILGKFYRCYESFSWYGHLWCMLNLPKYLDYIAVQNNFNTGLMREVSIQKYK